MAMRIRCPFFVLTILRVSFVRSSSFRGVGLIPATHAGPFTHAPSDDDALSATLDDLGDLDLDEDPAECSAEWDSDGELLVQRKGQKSSSDRGGRWSALSTTCGEDLSLSLDSSLGQSGSWPWSLLGDGGATEPRDEAVLQPSPPSFEDLLSTPALPLADRFREIPGACVCLSQACHQAWNVYKRTAFLAHLNDEKGAWQRRLLDPDDQRLNEALQRLVRVAVATGCIEPLRQKCMEHPTSRVRMAGLRSLTLSPAVARLERRSCLLRGLADEFEDIRGFCVDKLVEMIVTSFLPDEEAVVAISGCLEDSSGLVRAAVINALGRFSARGGRAIIARISDTGLPDPDPAVRVATMTAIATIAEANDTDVIRTLVDIGLTDLDRHVCKAAVKGLLHILPHRGMNQHVVEALARPLRARNRRIIYQIRQTVIEAIGSLSERGNAEAIAAVESFLTDETPAVRARVCKALGRIVLLEEEEGVKLLALLEARTGRPGESDAEVQAAARAAIAQITRRRRNGG